MEPAAVLGVIVKTSGVRKANAELAGLQAQLKRTDAAAAAAGASMVKSGNKMMATGRMLNRRLTLPIVAVGAAAVDMSLKFNRAMSLIQTQAGASAKEAKYLKKEVLSLAKDSKFAPDEVADALFRVRSAGFEGRKGIDVLREGMHLATLGNSDLEMTTKALTGAAKSLGEEGTKAMRKLSAEINATVGTGDMRMEEMQDALSTGIIPTFVAAGMSFRDFGAALTVMTDRNVPARVAATRLRMAISLLAAPTDKAEKALGKVGIGSKTLAHLMRGPEGLPKAIEELRQHLEGVSKIDAMRVLTEAFGGAKSSATIAMLVENSSELPEKWDLIAEGVGKYNKQIKIAEENPLVELEKAWSSIQVSLVEVGDVLIPVVVPGLKAAAAAMSTLATGFAGLSGDWQAALLTVGLGLGPFMSMMGRMKVAFGEMKIAAGVAGESTGMFFVKGMIRKLGMLALVFSVTDVLSSVFAHKWEEVGFKLGGMMVGGIAGFLVGGPAGAMIGAAFGELIGGMLTPGETLAPMQKRLKEAAEGVASAMHNEKHTAHAVAGAQERVHDASKEARNASRRLAKAEEHLKEVRQSGHSTAIQTFRAELKVYNSFVRSARATTRKREALELLHFAEHQHFRSISQVVHSNAVAIALEKKHIFHLRERMRQEGASDELRDKAAKALNNLTKYQGNYDEAIKLARHRNKEWAHSLEEMTTAQHKFGEKGRSLRRAIKEQSDRVKEMRTSIHEASSQFSGMELHGAEHKLENMRRTYRRLRSQIDDARNGMQPFAHQTGQQMTKAQEALQGFETTSLKAVGNSRKALQNFAKSLGITGAHFGVEEQKGKSHKKARGGLVVPGSGTGDKVPLSIMAEPGEVVHVLNMRASKDRKMLGGLERRNNEVPRFQKGGTEAGNMAAAVRKAAAIDAAHFPYVWGGGHGSFNGPYDCSGAVSAILHAAGVLGQPMVSGELANFGAPGPGALTIFANATHAFMKVGNRFFGTSGSNPGGGAGYFPTPVGEAEANEGNASGAFSVRHPTGIANIGALPTFKVSGPAGELTSTAQKVSDIAHAMASKWAMAHMPGHWGGGDAFNGPGKVVGASTYGGPADSVSGTVGAAGVSLPGTHGFAELGMGHNLGGLPFHSKLLLSRAGRSVVGEKLDIGLGGGDVQGHRRDIDLWYQTAEALGLPNSWLGLIQVNKAMQKGGSIKAGMANVLHGLSEGKHLPKYRGALKRLTKRIGGEGLPDKRLNHIADVSGTIEKYAEFAQNASGLTVEDEEGNVVQGMFKGLTEGGWLQKQLESLMVVRAQVLGAWNAVTQKYIPRIHKLLKEAKGKLTHVEKAIRDAERKKRELEQKVKEIERARDKSKSTQEGELKNLEHALSKEEHQKHPDKTKLEALRAAVHAKKEQISGGDKGTKEAIHKLKEEVTSIAKANKARGRVRDALKSSIIPALMTQQTGAHETAAALFGDGGEVKGKAFMGLRAIQGMGGSTGVIPNPPKAEEVGGELYNVLSRMRQIDEEARKAKGEKPGEEGDSRLREIEAELGRQAQARYLVSQAQYGVMQKFPFAGGFERGGVVAAEVGEKGRELLFTKPGSRVVSKRESDVALRQAAANHVTIEHLTIHSDGTATVRMNGKDQEAEVKKVTRKQARGSMSRTPGGKGLRG